MNKYRVDDETVEAVRFKVVGGALVFFKNYHSDIGFKAFGAGEWKKVFEGGEVEVKPENKQVPAPVPVDVAPSEPAEPSVLTSKLWAWVNKVKENTPAGSFPYDTELIGMIEKAEGGRKYAEPEPDERKDEFKKGKMD